MIYHKLSRRHFLQGAGGVALAIPVLPSLLARNAFAASAPLPKFYVGMLASHGGESKENMYPIHASVSAALTTKLLYESTGGYPAHDIRYGTLLNLKKKHAETAVLYRNQTLKDFDNGAARVSPFVGSFVP